MCPFQCSQAKGSLLTLETIAEVHSIAGAGASGNHLISMTAAEEDLTRLKALEQLSLNQFVLIYLQSMKHTIVYIYVQTYIQYLTKMSTPLTFLQIYYIFSWDNTEEMTLLMCHVK